MNKARSIATFSAVFLGALVYGPVASASNSNPVDVNAIRLEGDFNGDGLGDLIITTGSGSYEYTGLSTGGFTPNVWFNTDLPKNSVSYAVGDFNGDKCSDLIITTGYGSFEYTGNGPTCNNTGTGFTANVWSRPDLTLNNVAYGGNVGVNDGFSEGGAVGDFNGDGCSDLIITTAQGSFEYTGNGPTCNNTGTGFTANVWSRTDLTLGNAIFTVGDYNADGVSDVLISTASGTYEYAGQKAGGFQANVWTDTSLPWIGAGLGFWPADYNGDGATDFLVMTSSGTSEFVAAGGGGFNVAWTDSSLYYYNTIDAGWNWNAAFCQGDFNGDDIADVLITTSQGTFLYEGNSAGGFYANQWTNASMSLGNVNFAPNDFLGNGLTDIMVTTAAGSSEYEGGFFTIVWQDAALTLGSVSYY